MPPPKVHRRDRAKLGEPLNLGIKQFKREHPHKKTKGSVIAEYKAKAWAKVKEIR